MRQLADGSISNVTFCQLLVEGVDCPAIGCIIGLRPTYSLAGFLQTNGRMLRVIYAPGYDLSTREGRFAAIDAGSKGRKGIFLDHAGLTFRHGFIDEVREWSLLGAPKKPKETELVVAIRQCPICMIVFPPAPVCPGCGHVFQVHAREIQKEDGELGLLTPEMMEIQDQKQRRIDVGKADTREELEAIAKARNYSPAWVHVQMRIKEGKKKALTQKQQWLEDQAKIASANRTRTFDWPEV
jgi:superfamily II DNA or RNA helicase